MKQASRTYALLELMQREWGQRIRTQRLALGLTQGQLGDLAGLDQAVISRAERGKGGLSDDSKCRVAAALGMDFDDLFRGQRAAA
jgi:transcriptional regulator with XRE-family HTH domain